MTRTALALSLLISFSASAYTAFTPDARTGPAAFNQFEPSIAAHGNDYLAAWTSRGGVWISTLDAPIATPLDPGNDTAHGVSLSSGRDGYFAAWTSDQQLSAAVIDSFGRVERTTRVPIANTSGSIGGTTYTAWNGAVHIVLCQCGTLNVTLFDDNANVIAGPIDIGNPNARVGVTADDNGFLVVSSHVTPTADSIYGRRISSSGVAGDWFLIRETASVVQGLAATADGARDVIAWGDQFGVWSMAIGEPSAQLTPATAMITDALVEHGRLWIAYLEGVNGAPHYLTIGPDRNVTPPVRIQFDGFPARLASNGTSVLAVGTAAIADEDVFGSYITPASAGEPFLISRSKTDQENGWLAGNLLVWDEQVIQKRQVFIGGTSRAGKQLSFNGNNTNPVALFNGTSYLVVWINRDNEGRQAIHARRVAPGEVILDDQDIVIPSGGTVVVRVAWDGVNWLVASVQTRANQGVCFASGGTRVVLNRISADGVPLDGEGVFLPAPEGFSASDVDVEWTGSRYLVAWTNRCVAFHTPTSTNVRAAFVSADLSDIDDFVVAPVITGTAYEVPRVAASAQQSLIAWSAGNTTQYRLISGVPAARRRGFGAAASAVDGRLLDVTHNRSGTFSLYLLADPTFAVGIHGLFESVIFPGGTRTIPVFRFGYGFNEAITGNVDDSLGFPRVVDMMLNGSFDPAAGAWRLWWREVPGER